MTKNVLQTNTSSVKLQVFENFGKAIFTHLFMFPFDNHVHPSINVFKGIKRKYYPVDIYMFKVNNRNTKTRCEIYSKVTI